MFKLYRCYREYERYGKNVQKARGNDSRLGYDCIRSIILYTFRKNKRKVCTFYTFYIYIYIYI